MSPITLVITALLSLSLAYFIVLLLIRIRNNVVAGHSYRDALTAELSELRAYKMLGALGINRQRYIHQQSVLDIHKHMDRCKACGNITECDEKLASNSIDPNHIEFCNNADEFSEMAKQGDEAEARPPQ